MWTHDPVPEHGWYWVYDGSEVGLPQVKRLLRNGHGDYLAPTPLHWSEPIPMPPTPNEDNRG